MNDKKKPKKDEYTYPNQKGYFDGDVLQLKK